jgi:hypothetical protein
MSSSADDLILLGRAVERVLTVVIAGMSIYLGYKLFARLPFKADSTGKIALPGGISVYMARVGPGVFFALFGSAITWGSLAYPVSITSGTPSRDASSSAPIEATVQELRYDTSRSDLNVSLTEAREQIYVLNRDLPALLKPDLPSTDRERLYRARDYCKRTVLGAVWQPEWGPFKDFSTWIAGGSSASAQASEPARIYRYGLEEPK